MTLHLIGIGLYDHKDITVRGLEILQSCEQVYLEYYTSILGISPEDLSTAWGKEIQIATRDIVEKEAEKLLITPAKDKDIALLIIGDVFGATTHADLMLRAKQAGVDVKVTPNASILNAVGITGLELYKFGKTTSIVFPDDGWLPATPYEVIKNNQSLGLHTLCLLDIKVAEPSKEDLLKGITTPQPPRFMTVSEGLTVLQQIESTQQQQVISDDSVVIGLARVGQPDMIIKAGTLQEIKNVDFGAPLHSIIVPGKLHHIEEEVLASLK